MQEPIATVINVDREDLNDDLAAIWARLRSDPGTRSFAEARGIDLASVDALGDEVPFVTEPSGAEAREKGGGNLTVVEAILVGIAVAQANEVLKKSQLLDKIWDCLVEPAIEKAGRIIRRTPKAAGSSDEE